MKIAGTVRKHKHLKNTPANELKNKTLNANFSGEIGITRNLII